MMITSIPSFLKKHKYKVIFFCIILIHIFFRFYQLENRLQFTWDQVDNAWHAKNMLINKEYPLLGMQGKQSSGIFIGPFYYYFITFFYFLTNLDPIASGLAAGVTSLITFCVLFFVTKKIFSAPIALVASFLYAISFYAIYSDRVQWPVNFIPVLSLGIFYALYQIMLGKLKYLYLLMFLLGFSFHIHFTSIFYLPLILIALPFFPRNKTTLVHALVASVLFLVWLVPLFLVSSAKESLPAHSLSSFLHNNYHGFHLRRFFQIANDAFYEFQNPLLFPVLYPLKFLFLPLFLFLYGMRKPSREKTFFCYLLIMWIFIPWILFSTYRGDLTDYYFSSIRLQVIIVVSYLALLLLKSKSKLFVGAFILLFCIYVLKNIQEFVTFKERGLGFYRQKVLQDIKDGKGNEFTYGSPETYLYYFYKRKFYGVE